MIGKLEKIDKIQLWSCPELDNKIEKELSKLREEQKVTKNEDLKYLSKKYGCLYKKRIKLWVKECYNK